MRLLKAEFKKITFALFVILLALTLVQCIFVVGGAAEAESPAYRELISDYFSFNAPTRIAVCGDDFAVFDSGKVVLFLNGSRRMFDTRAEECDKLVLSSEAVYLLTGLTADAPEILVYSLDGTEKDYVIPSEKVTDISFAEGKLYTLASLLSVKGYAADGSLAESYELPGMNFSIRFAAEAGRAYFRKYDGTVIKREGDTVTPLEGIGEVSTLSAMGGKLYYAKDNVIRILGQTSTLLPKSDESGDALFTTLNDFAVGDDIYVLDGTSSAVKVYDKDGNYQKMIGAAGQSLGRLRDPVALTVKGGRVLVADGVRGSEFGESVRALKGRNVSSATDIARTEAAVYLADGGILYEYDASLKSPKDHSYFSSSCLCVTASPNGTVYASSGRDIYQKTADASAFSKSAIAADGTIEGLTVGIGGNILYVLTEGVISAYAESGVRIARLSVDGAVKGFSVDYRGNIYVATESALKRYERIPQGYDAPTTVALLPDGYAEYGDLAFDESGRTYVIADHNVLIYAKETLGVAIKEDGAFVDDVPSVHPRFICEVVKDTVVAYVSPGNFEDITIVPKGQRLMCYAYVSYAGTQYVRASWGTGKVYIALGDVKIYDEGAAPFRKARCLIPAIGEPVGVNIYSEPVEKGAPLFAALGRDEVFDVISYVAVDDEGRDVWGFYRVSYAGKEGYVCVDDVVDVDSEPQPMPKTIDMQVKSDGLGKTVAIYKEASIDSEVLGTLSDGSRIRVIEPFDENSVFSAVLYRIDGKDEVCYVLTMNVGKNGLSAGQILAIVLSVVAVIGSVLTILILRANKKHKRMNKE